MNKEQKIAKNYLDWLNKNPFGEEYTISTNDFEFLLFGLEQKSKEINLLRESKTNVEHNRKLLSEEKQKLINALRCICDRAQIAQREEDEWGWAQALKRIQQQIREVFKEIRVAEE